jgi:hypothetical protein
MLCYDRLKRNSYSSRKPVQVKNVAQAPHPRNPGRYSGSVGQPMKKTKESQRIGLPLTLFVTFEPLCHLRISTASGIHHEVRGSPHLRKDDGG